MIRRHKTTIFTDAKESSTVFELKRIVEGILKRPPDEQRLYKVRSRRFRAAGGWGSVLLGTAARAWPWAQGGPVVDVNISDRLPRAGTPPRGAVARTRGDEAPIALATPGVSVRMA